MLQKKAITEVPPSLPGFYSNVFLVRKASGGWHPIIDLKSLNVHIWAPHFRMYTTGSVLSTVRKGDYAFKIDLQDAYFHVPIHPSSRKYLRFAFENKVYQFWTLLLFGLNTAPLVFTCLGHTVTGYLHRLGISVVPYLEDWLIHHPDRQVLLLHQARLLETLDLVGFVLNEKKSELYLVQDIQFLGIRLRLDLGVALLPESKAQEIAARACKLSSLRVLSYHQVAQLMGSLNWASGLLSLGRLHLRPLQRYFHSLGLTDRFIPPRRSDPSVLASLLQQWQDLSFLTSGIPIRPFQADFTIFSATVSNSRLPQFMSPIPEPQALAVDALSQDWQGRSMYMFPPFPLLSKVIQKLRSTQEAEVILISPWWPKQSWFPHLLRLCVDHSFLTVEIFCHNRIRDMSRMESRTVCTHGGSRATLQSSRLFRQGL